jgi:hypothetical protein
MLRKTDYNEHPGEDPSWSGGGTSSEEETSNPTMDDSDLSKLKLLCPSFFSTLTSWEIDVLIS